MMHHTPAKALSNKKTLDEGLERAWYFCCVDEAILPSKPSRLPLLFAIDAKLKIADGFHYFLIRPLLMLPIIHNGSMRII